MTATDALTESSSPAGKAQSAAARPIPTPLDHDGQTNGDCKKPRDGNERASALPLTPE
jgi:hypothetical protein